ncbi:hypothetical protein C8R42DRAFT_645660 [Lentinula raphanica]|nr:hypothetical protein C8R42DRAFT_645660 [Lentinula raphanica]
MSNEGERNLVGSIWDALAGPALNEVLEASGLGSSHIRETPILLLKPTLLRPYIDQPVRAFANVLALSFGYNSSWSNSSPNGILNEGWCLLKPRRFNIQRTHRKRQLPSSLNVRTFGQPGFSENQLLTSKLVNAVRSLERFDGGIETHMPSSPKSNSYFVIVSRFKDSTPAPTAAQDLLVKSSKSKILPKMYLLRLVFTWHSLVANILLLSMILATIALPISEETRKRDRETAGLDVAGPSNNAAIVTSSGSNGSRTPSNMKPPIRASASNIVEIRPKPLLENPLKYQGSKKFKLQTTQAMLSKTSKAWSTPKEFIVVVVIKNGRAEWIKEKEVDPLASWIVALIPSEDLTSKGRFWGYETVRHEDSVTHEYKWELKVDEKGGKWLYGTQFSSSSEHLLLKIGTATMSRVTQSALTSKMRRKITKYRSDELPSVLSIYQFLHLFQDEASHTPHIEVSDFDISESSEFGKAFKQIVRKKGTGAGGVMSQWEWELYERIQMFFESQDIEDDLHHPALAGPSPGHN